MIKLVENPPIYLELYQALAHFVARQQLVIRAVIELGVQPETLVGVGAWRGKTPQVGTWGDEWEFFFHGGGCELRSRQSGEPIDWNGPDPLAFGWMSFIHHLEWRLANEPGLPELRAFVSKHDLIAVLDLIQELIDGGVVTPDRHIEPGTPAAQQAA
jgi:hypothetical protein